MMDWWFMMDEDTRMEDLLSLRKSMIDLLSLFDWHVALSEKHFIWHLLQSEVGESDLAQLPSSPTLGRLEYLGRGLQRLQLVNGSKQSLSRYGLGLSYDPYQSANNYNFRNKRACRHHHPLRP